MNTITMRQRRLKSIYENKMYVPTLTVAHGLSFEIYYHSPNGNTLRLSHKEAETKNLVVIERFNYGSYHSRIWLFSQSIEVSIVHPRDEQLTPCDPKKKRRPPTVDV